MEKTAPPERPKNLCQVADYLLSPQSGVKKRDGVFNDSRVIYFRGKGAVNALLKPEFGQTAVGKELGELTRESAAQLLGSMIPHQFFLKVERPSDPEMPKNMLQLVQYQSFGEDGIFVWRYEGSQLRSHLMAGLLLLIVLAGVMFPLWPPGIWIFPNLFEDVGFVDSFIPLWGWHEPEAPVEKKSAKKIQAGEEAQAEVETQVISEEVAEKVTKRRPMVEDAADEDAL
ncbi:Translocation protein S62 [Podila minutissima]|uniref:Translocation protein SEC62 n=1 Tax=Podila minutissima TaxID=64525 RepID=A0A9P5SFS5_9FUNG|nr:Translocation protein S62 [Podila minutissima]